MLTSMVTVLIVFMSISCQVTASTPCYICRDMPSPTDCNKVTTCGSSQVCFVDQVITSSGTVIYHSGCRAKDLCSNRKRDIYKRQEPGDITICSECCHGEFCNNEGCGQTAPLRQDRGPMCFSCISQSNPNTCRTITQCDKDEFCGLKHETMNANHFTSGCFHKSQCAFLTQTDGVGKRQTSYPCATCCYHDYCNTVCNSTSTFRQDSVTPTTKQTNILEYKTSFTVEWTTPAVDARSSTSAINYSSALSNTRQPNDETTTISTLFTRKSTRMWAQTQKPSTTTHPGLVSLNETPANGLLPNITTPSAATTLNTESSTNWGPWSKWSSCSCERHFAFQSRKRNCSNQHNCTGPKYEYTRCSASTCTEIHPRCPHKEGYSVAHWFHDVEVVLCLKLERNPADFSSAMTRCEEHHGQLAVLCSSYEILTLQRWLSNNGASNGSSAWIGLRSGNNTWSWTDGAPIESKALVSSGWSSDKCVSISSQHLLAYPCSALKQFVCQIRL